MKKLFLFGIIGFAIIVLASAMSEHKPDKPMRPRVGGSESSARIEAQRCVRAKLKYSASFGWGVACVLEEGNTKAYVAGDVETMNGFGAKRTQQYQVQLKWDGKTWNEYVTSIGDENFPSAAFVREHSR